MRKILILLLWVSWIVTAGAQELIGVDDIVFLKELGYSDQQILEEMQKGGQKFGNFTADDLKKLKDAGVGEEFIRRIQAAAKRPEPAAELLEQGKLKAKNKDYKGAIAAFTQAIKLCPDYVEAYVERADSRISEKDYAQAIADCDRAIALQPDYGKAFNTRGVAHYCAKSSARAMIDFTRAIHLTPDFFWPHYNRGFLLAEQGMDEATAADYARFLTLAPENEDTSSAIADAHYFLNRYYGGILSATRDQLSRGQFQTVAERLQRLAGGDNRYLPPWAIMLIDYQRAAACIGAKDVANGLIFFEKAVAGGFDLFMDIEEIEVFHSCSANPKFTQIYSRMRISDADVKEILWLKGEIQSVYHDVNMMIISNMNRQDSDYTTIYFNAIPDRPTASRGVEAYRWFLRHAQFEARPLVMESDTSRILHLTNLHIIENMGSNPRPLWQKQEEINRSRSLAQERERSHKAEVDARAWSLPPGTSTMARKCPALQSIGKKESDKNPKYAQTCFDYANRLFDNRDYPAALRNYEKAIALDPGFADACFNLVNCLLEMKEYQSALSACARVVQLEPDAPRTYLQRALVRFYLNDFAKAVEDTSRAIELNSSLAIGYNNRAASYLKLGKYREAKKDLDVVLSMEESTSTPYAYFNLAHLSAIRGDREQALDYLELALKHGYVALEELDRTPALEFVQEDPRFAEMMEIYKYTVGEHFAAMGDKEGALKNYQSAVDFYDQALRFNPELGTYINRSHANFCLKRYREVIEDCNRVLDLDPKQHLAYLNRSAAYGSLEKYEKALDDAQRSLDISPHSLAYSNKGFFLLRLGRRDEALRILEEGLAMYPKSPNAYENLACCHAAGGNNAEALACLELALIFGFEEVDPDSADFDSLRTMPEFIALVARYRKNSGK